MELSFAPLALQVDVEFLGRNWYWFFSGSLLFGVIAWFVGNSKGQGCLGCILGLILGPFGLLITALLGRK